VRRDKTEVMGMVDQSLGTAFQASRQRLHAIAFRMLGSQVEADDAVQDTWLRLSSTDPERIDNLNGWLTTVVGRVCLDRLRSRRTRREDLVGDEMRDLPGPARAQRDPADEAVIAESIGAALLVVLDSLGPAERVAFVLHDIFAVGFDEVAEIVGRSPAAARQLASRARRRVQGTSGPTQLDLVRQREVVDAFLRAARTGDFDALVQVLDPTVVLHADAAAEEMGSFPTTEGAVQVASMLAGGARTARRATVNGLAGLVWAPGGRVRSVIQFTVVEGLITAIDVTADAERINGFDIAVLDT
jgi:RNA polymerase sigma-70 factor (ECF subfamily)